MGAVALSAADPSLRLAKLLTPAAVAQLPVVETECTDAIISRFTATPWRHIFYADPTRVPGVRSALSAMPVVGLPKDVPVLVARAEMDDQVPPTVLAHTIRRLCRDGSTVTTQTFKVGHDDLVDAAGNTVLSWLDDRYRDRPAMSSCPRTLGNTH
jgi:hypothetical protein